MQIGLDIKPILKHRISNKSSEYTTIRPGTPLLNNGFDFV